MEHPHVTVVALADARVVAAVGDFDIGSVDVLRDAMMKALQGSSKVALDLSGTAFLDSVALGAIVSAGKRARDLGGWVRLVAPSPYVRRALRVTMIDSVLGLFESAEEAVAHEGGVGTPD